MAKIITIAQQKGGSGKTTLAANLAVSFSLRHNLKTTILDADPQGSLGKWFIQRESKLKDKNFIKMKTSSLWGVQYESNILKDETDIIIKEVPGAFELPLATQFIAEKEKVSSVISLGAIVKGDTPHFDFISDACINGLQTIALKTNVPIICGVLTTNTIEQAAERSDPDKMNKGKEFALSAMNMVSVLD